MDLCDISQTTARKYRREFLAEHPKEKMPKPDFSPNVSKKEKSLRSSAISTKEIEKIRRKIKVGDIIPLQSLKMAEMLSGTEPTNGRATKGVVVSTKSRYFCVVRLSNGVTEAILWTDLVKSSRRKGEK